MAENKVIQQICAVIRQDVPNWLAGWLGLFFLKANSKKQYQHGVHSWE
jgi:hypothetical protein